MSLTQLLFVACLLAVVAVAMKYGRHDEHIGALAVVMAAILTPIARQSGYMSAEVGILIVDFLLCSTFGWLALRSRRFWPMWAAGFQLGAVWVHVAAARLPHLSPGAYAETLAIFSYPVLVTLILGSLVEARRVEARLS
jgi:hypothetical protein